MFRSIECDRKVATLGRFLLRGVLTSIVLCASLIQGGVASASQSPIPETSTVPVIVSQMGKVRYWGDVAPKNLDKLIEARRAELEANPDAKARASQANFLALSGGGDNGAFGAGLLAGWTKAGSRPKFEIVTGVSTGALIAPFAFLGSRYDPTLKTIYTQYEAADLLSMRPLGGLISGRAVADNTGLARLIAKYVDRNLLQAIAREHKSGRKLLVGTTDLAAQRPVIWDMGAIAGNRHPDSLELFRQVLLASAAIPGIFPPVQIDQVIDGKRHIELHVDGGTTTSVFLLPTPIMLGSLDRKLGIHSNNRLFIIRNGKVGPEPEEVDSRNTTVAKRAITTLTKSHSVGDIYRLYATSKRDNIAFNLAFIPQDFRDDSADLFNKSDMNRLFSLGFDLGRSGYKWKMEPPGF